MENFKIDLEMVYVAASPGTESLAPIKVKISFTYFFMRLTYILHFSG